MQCNNCHKRSKCVEICRDVEALLQKITTTNKDDVFHHLYEKPYNPEEWFQRFFINNVTINYSYWGFNSLEEASEALKVVISTKLDSRQKFILELYYKSGLTQRQIASILGKTQPVIARTLERTRNKLRTEFEYLRKNLRKPQKYV